MPLTDYRNDSALLEALAGAALKAGEVVMQIREAGFEATLKADESPVTAADIASEALLRDELAMILPGIPVIAEEAVSRGAGEAPASTFLLVDPLDGTREFVGASGEFTINIGLIVDGIPVLGIIYAPAVGKLYVGGAGAFLAHRAPGSAPDRVPRGRRSNAAQCRSLA